MRFSRPGRGNVDIREQSLLDGFYEIDAMSCDRSVARFGANCKTALFGQVLDEIEPGNPRCPLADLSRIE
jgi:hypothetical protein